MSRTVQAEAAVSGQTRFKFFRRPIQPRISAFAPSVLLAASGENPMVVEEEVAEPDAKTVGVQTIYRESEAQTVPYTPQYFVPEGATPEVLLLKGFTAGNGLPVSDVEMKIIESIRFKKDLESNLPPFTDECSLMFRKRLLENQEVNEMKLREAEIDNRASDRLDQLEKTLHDRNETHEFYSAQRIEAIRQVKMAEHSRTMEKLKSKRIKVLRRLATRRNDAIGNNSEGGKQSRDIISDYFTKTSTAYAPTMRDGKDVEKNTQAFDAASRTIPLDTMPNISALEDGIGKDMVIQKVTRLSLSNTAPLPKGRNGGRVTEDRLTSAAQRNIRTVKRDVELMNNILSKNKAERAAAAALARNRLKEQNTGMSTPAPSTAATSSLLSKKPKGRPTTPDLTADKDGEPVGDNLDIMAACVLLQRLLRGRAVQNAMYEGKQRRRELIAELRESDEKTFNPALQVSVV